MEVNGNVLEESESLVPTDDVISTESMVPAPSKKSLDNFSTDDELTAAVTTTVPDVSDHRSSPGSSQKPPTSDENVSASITDAVPRPSPPSTPPATIVQTPTKKPPRLNAQAIEFSEKRLNLASKSSGATVLEHSAEFKYVDHILNSERNEYGIVPCITRINDNTKMKFVTIGLGVDAYVDTVALENNEAYSGTMSDVQVLGSGKYPTKEWQLMGDITVENNNHRQAFKLPRPAWVQFLKFRFRAHHGDQFYCTLTSIIVNGDSMIDQMQKQLDSANLHADLEDSQAQVYPGDEDMDAEHPVPKGDSVTHMPLSNNEVEGLESTTSDTLSIELDEAVIPSDLTGTTVAITDDVTAIKAAASTSKDSISLENEEGEGERITPSGPVPSTGLSAEGIEFTRKNNAELPIQASDHLEKLGEETVALETHKSIPSQSEDGDLTEAHHDTGTDSTATVNIKGGEVEQSPTRIIPNLPHVDGTHADSGEGATPEVPTQDDVSSTSGKDAVNKKQGVEVNSDLAVPVAEVGEEAEMDSMDIGLAGSSQIFGDSKKSVTSKPLGSENPASSSKSKATDDTTEPLQAPTPKSTKEVSSSPTISSPKPSSTAPSTKKKVSHSTAKNKATSASMKSKTKKNIATATAVGVSSSNSLPGAMVEKLNIFEAVLPKALIPPPDKRIDLPRTGAKIENIFTTFSTKLKAVESGEDKLRQHFADTILVYNSILTSLHQHHLESIDNIAALTARVGAAEAKAEAVSGSLERIYDTVTLLVVSTGISFCFHLYFAWRGIFYSRLYVDV